MITDDAPVLLLSGKLTAEQARTLKELHGKAADLHPGIILTASTVFALQTVESGSRGLQVPTLAVTGHDIRHNREGVAAAIARHFGQGLENWFGELLTKTVLGPTGSAQPD